jgi:hypothetical protein
MAISADISPQRQKTTQARPPLPAAPIDRGIGRLLCREGQRRSEARFRLLEEPD